MARTFFERPLIVGGSAASATNNLSLLLYPAKKVPSLVELGILVKVIIGAASPGQFQAAKVAPATDVA